jgi:hypothetical protein
MQWANATAPAGGAALDEPPHDDARSDVLRSAAIITNAFTSSMITTVDNNPTRSP